MQAPLTGRPLVPPEGPLEGVLAAGAAAALSVSALITGVCRGSVFGVGGGPATVVAEAVPRPVALQLW